MNSKINKAEIRCFLCAILVFDISDCMKYCLAIHRFIAGVATEKNIKDDRNMGF
jgi:hypothetical protein